MKPEILTELFTRAEHEEIGIAIETNNPESLLQALHAHRKAAGFWSDITIALPSTSNFVFLAHKSVELD